MKNKVYYLSSCSTCKRIMDSLSLSDFIKQDIKTESITEEQIDEMFNLSGSYLSLFSKRSMKYKAFGLADKELTEEDYKSYILQEYTFLKRPVFIVNNEIFIGNSKKEVERLTEKLK